MENLLRQWLHRLPAPVKEAAREALRSAQMGKIRHALRLLEEIDEAERGPALNIEILSTFNLEPVAPLLSLALTCIPSQPTLQVAPLDTLEASISKPPFTVNLDVRVIFWRVEEILPEILYPLTNGFPEKMPGILKRLLERIERLIHLHLQATSGVPLFLSTLAWPVKIANPVFAAQHDQGMFALVGRVNEEIYRLATTNREVRVFDLAGWAAKQGEGFADTTLDYIARQPLTARSQASLAMYLARTLRPLVVARKKALAIDLDNTLWGGVVGEDGVAALKLGPDFPGNVHLRLQKELLELRQRGILLVLLSKNNETDAREAFASLPGMVLQWDDFAARKIDWAGKPENLRAAAAELKLGLDSFAYIDDSDYEREQMKQFLPEVLILNETNDPLTMLQALWETDAFESYSIAFEDRERNDDYKLRTARDASAGGNDVEAFLRSLEMQIAFEEIGPSNFERVVAMLGKTNQFNLTTQRHSRAHLQELISMPGSIALAARFKDRFGDQGIIGAAVAIPKQDSQLTIDSFLLSCRALGRGVEDALWAELVNRAHGKKVAKIEANYRATAKNSLVADLYDRYGMRRTEESPSGTRYELSPITPQTLPSWIAVTEKRNGNAG